MSATIKCKNMMYTQQMQHLPAKTIDNLVCLIHNLNPEPKKSAVIVHDKDIDENGQSEEPHVHAMLSFENARSINNVANMLNDKPQYIAAWTKQDGNGFSYLIHATKRSKDKYHYNTSEVIANFDYEQEIYRISAEVSKAKNRLNVQTLLDALLDGTLTKKELEDKLSGSQYGRYHKQIDCIWNKRLINLADEWKKEMIEQKSKSK